MPAPWPKMSACDSHTRQSRSNRPHPRPEAATACPKSVHETNERKSEHKHRRKNQSKSQRKRPKMDAEHQMSTKKSTQKSRQKSTQKCTQMRNTGRRSEAPHARQSRSKPLTSKSQNVRRMPNIIALDFHTRQSRSANHIQEPKCPHPGQK